MAAELYFGQIVIPLLAAFFGAAIAVYLTNRSNSKIHSRARVEKNVKEAIESIFLLSESNAYTIGFLKEQVLPAVGQISHLTDLLERQKKNGEKGLEIELNVSSFWLHQFHLTKVSDFALSEGFSLGAKMKFLRLQRLNQEIRSICSTLNEEAEKIRSHFGNMEGVVDQISGRQKNDVSDVGYRTLVDRLHQRSLEFLACSDFAVRELEIYVQRQRLRHRYVRPISQYPKSRFHDDIEELVNPETMSLARGIGGIQKKKKSRLISLIVFDCL